MKAVVKPVPLLEPDSDGPYRVGTVYGIQILDDDGSPLTRPDCGITGPREAMETLCRIANERLNSRRSQDQKGH